ncbi:basic proline-rich protein-like isoform X2 [Mercenaria mercenaria]|uniref:basic proline-rich protein-like isoform X2 n=1 Tax=Mercenaria mercenaria TaxID=6596 RepID=UPI00234EE639|nr:basic proline-rich protein-like isoform X2 [Mercenaria mercenaria]
MGLEFQESGNQGSASRDLINLDKPAFRVRPPWAQTATAPPVSSGRVAPLAAAMSSDSGMDLRSARSSHTASHSTSLPSMAPPRQPGTSDHMPQPQVPGPMFPGMMGMPPPPPGHLDSAPSDRGMNLRSARSSNTDSHSTSLPSVAPPGQPVTSDHMPQPQVPGPMFPGMMGMPPPPPGHLDPAPSDSGMDLRSARSSHTASHSTSLPSMAPPRQPGTSDHMPQPQVPGPMFPGMMGMPPPPPGHLDSAPSDSGMDLRSARSSHTASHSTSLPSMAPPRQPGTSDHMPQPQVPGPMFPGMMGMPPPPPGHLDSAPQQPQLPQQPLPPQGPPQGPTQPPQGPTQPPQGPLRPPQGQPMPPRTQLQPPQGQLGLPCGQPQQQNLQQETPAAIRRRKTLRQGNRAGPGYFKKFL